MNTACPPLFLMLFSSDASLIGPVSISEPHYGGKGLSAPLKHQDHDSGDECYWRAMPEHPEALYTQAINMDGYIWMVTR